jgi:hypothetical protein
MNGHVRVPRAPGAPRRLVATAIIVAGIALLWPSAVLGASPERLEYDLQFEGSIDCGTFTDEYTDYYHVREVDAFDEQGDLVMAWYHIEHHSDDVTSVTGATLHEHGHFYEVDDYVAGTYTLTGSREIASLPGQGVVVQDAGRIVLDADFELAFFAGGRKHSQDLLGEGIFCDALG